MVGRFLSVGTVGAMSLTRIRHGHPSWQLISCKLPDARAEHPTLTSLAIDLTLIDIGSLGSFIMRKSVTGIDIRCEMEDGNGNVRNTNLGLFLPSHDLRLHQQDEVSG